MCIIFAQKLQTLKLFQTKQHEHTKGLPKNRQKRNMPEFWPLWTEQEEMQCLVAFTQFESANFYLARMAEKAECPGVSKKVIMPPESGISTWNAPICCVIPPASPAATLVFLKASNKLVLPWSTWPMIVTTGGLGTASLLRSYNNKGDVLLYSKRSRASLLLNVYTEQTGL